MKLDDIRVGFIGFGNMAQAIAEGLVLKHRLRAEQISACARDWEKLCRNTQPSGMHPCKDLAETVQCSDLVIISVKPQTVPEVIDSIKELLHDKIVISVAAGYPFETYEKLLLPGTHHLSTIPNTPVCAGEGIFVCEKRHSLTDEEYRLMKDLFSGIGIVQEVETQQLDIAGTISGCGPAFVSMFIEALADAAVLYGLPRELSYRLAAQMIAGTAKLQLRTGEHPGVMKDAVCSPGGSTIVGVAALERGGFRSAVIEAVAAIEEK